MELGQQWLYFGRGSVSDGVVIDNRCGRVVCFQGCGCINYYCVETIIHLINGDVFWYGRVDVCAFALEVLSVIATANNPHSNPLNRPQSHLIII